MCMCMCASNLSFIVAWLVESEISEQVFRHIHGDTAKRSELRALLPLIENLHKVRRQDSKWRTAVVTDAVAVRGIDASAKADVGDGREIGLTDRVALLFDELNGRPEPFVSGGLLEPRLAEAFLEIPRVGQTTPVIPLASIEITCFYVELGWLHPLAKLFGVLKAEQILAAVPSTLHLCGQVAIRVAFPVAKVEGVLRPLHNLRLRLTHRQ